MKIFIATVVIIFALFGGIVAPIEISILSDKIKENKNNCLTYHEELPYNKALETCDFILNGKGEKK